MGLGLKILPATSLSESCELSNSILSISYSPTKILDVIKKVEDEFGIDVKRGGICSFIGKGSRYGKTEKTPYGERMKSILAKDFL